jgi:hypothetical protein
MRIVPLAWRASVVNKHPWNYADSTQLRRIDPGKAALTEVITVNKPDREVN